MLTCFIWSTCRLSPKLRIFADTRHWFPAFITSENLRSIRSRLSRLESYKACCDFKTFLTFSVQAAPYRVVDKLPAGRQRACQAKNSCFPAELNVNKRAKKYFYERAGISSKSRFLKYFEQTPWTNHCVYLACCALQFSSEYSIQLGIASDSSVKAMKGDLGTRLGIVWNCQKAAATSIPGVHSFLSVSWLFKKCSASQRLEVLSASQPGKRFRL